MKKCFDHKNFNSILIALVTGIIGCALWEKLLSPFWDFAFKVISHVLGSISSGYTDSTYCEISSGFNDSLLVYFFTITLSFMILFLFSALFLPLLQNKLQSLHSECTCNKIFRIINILKYVFFIIFFVSSCFIIGKLHFVNEKRTTALNNIEIVSPYISDLKYKQLKSEFYRISGSQDYDSLSTELSDIAHQNSISLKK